MKIVAITGSPRAEGNTSYLIDQALEEAKKLGVETEKINITQYRVNPCLGHDECASFTSCPQQDDAALLLQKLFEADGVILASPVYFFNVTAQLKALIDRSVFYRRRKQRLKAKTAGIITVARGGGIEPTENALINFLKLSSSMAPETIMRVHGLAGIQGEVQNATDLVEEARKLGRDMAKALTG